MSSLHKITDFIKISSYCISKVNLCGTALIMGRNLITRDIMIYYYLWTGAFPPCSGREGSCRGERDGWAVDVLHFKEITRYDELPKTLSALDFATAGGEKKYWGLKSSRAGASKSSRVRQEMQSTSKNGSCQNMRSRGGWGPINCHVATLSTRAVITDQATRPEDEHPLLISYNYESVVSIRFHLLSTGKAILSRKSLVHFWQFLVKTPTGSKDFIYYDGGSEIFIMWKGLHIPHIQCQHV